MHLSVIHEYQLREFLGSRKDTSEPQSHRWVEGEPPRTSRSLKRASTSNTSYQFSIRHNDPNRSGVVSKYDLSDAVYTTCANRINWSGVRAVNGMLGIAFKSSAVASDSSETLRRGLPNVFRMQSSFGRPPARYRRSASIDRLKSAVWGVRVAEESNS